MSVRVFCRRNDPRYCRRSGQMNNYFIVRPLSAVHAMEPRLCRCDFLRNRSHILYESIELSFCSWICWKYRQFVHIYEFMTETELKGLRLSSKIAFWAQSHWTSPLRDQTKQNHKQKTNNKYQNCFGRNNWTNHCGRCRACPIVPCARARLFCFSHEMLDAMVFAGRTARALWLANFPGKNPQTKFMFDTNTIFVCLLTIFTRKSFFLESAINLARPFKVYVCVVWFMCASNAKKNPLASMKTIEQQQRNITNYISFFPRVSKVGRAHLFSHDL